MPAVGIECVLLNRVVFEIDRSTKPLKLCEPCLVDSRVTNPSLEEVRRMNRGWGCKEETAVGAARKCVTLKSQKGGTPQLVRNVSLSKKINRAGGRLLELREPPGGSHNPVGSAGLRYGEDPSGDFLQAVLRRGEGLPKEQGAHLLHADCPTI